MHEVTEFMKSAVHCVIAVAVVTVILWIAVNVTLHFFGIHIALKL